MHLSTLTLRHYRNIEEESIKLHSRFNLIVGKNAQGKTNLLESIYYLSYLKPFRTVSKTDLIYKGKNEAFIGAQLEKENINPMIDDIQIVLQNQTRQIQLNGKRPHLFQEYYGLLPVLLFEPKDVYLFRESPSQRRHFITKALFLQDSSMVRLIADYEKVVLQKNRLLKEESGRSIQTELAVWNDKLASLGGQIIYKRIQWIQEINQYLSAEYHHLSHQDEIMKIEYNCRFPLPDLYEMGEQDIVHHLFLAMQQKESEEKIRREALVGPHRDDWTAFLDKRPLGLLGSQGENRSAIIALKSAQVQLFKAKYDQPPLFLLDDVASELDQARQEALFCYLRETQGQVFFTTTQIAEMTHYFQGEGASFLVEGGKVRVLE